METNALIIDALSHDAFKSLNGVSILQRQILAAQDSFWTHQVFVVLDQSHRYNIAGPLSSVNINTWNFEIPYEMIWIKGGLNPSLVHKMLRKAKISKYAVVDHSWFALQGFMLDELWTGTSPFGPPRDWAALQSGDISILPNIPPVSFAEQDYVMQELDRGAAWEEVYKEIWKKES